MIHPGTIPQPNIGSAGVNEVVQRSYDALASSYDRRWRVYIDASLAKVRAALSLTGDEQILDVACGTGELERRLITQWPGLHMIGVDISPNMLAQARAKPIEGDVTWLEAAAASLPVSDRCCDAVICANSFHYFRHPLDCLREFRRVLRPGGRLVLVDWCDDFLMCKLCSVWLKVVDPAMFHVYTLAEAKRLLRETGLELAHAERFKVSWLWGMMLLTAERVCAPND